MVVDNDLSASARETVLALEQSIDKKIIYIHESKKNIALARNHALKQDAYEYLAFIDDDEYADTDWLLELYDMAKKKNANVVNGPVHPDFEKTKNYFISRDFFEAYQYDDGEDDYLVKATGNCLLDLAYIKESGIVFNEKFGLSGGEDTLFFEELQERGAVFAWAKYALTYEKVGAERLSIKWIARRMFRVGNCLMRIKKQRRSNSYCCLFASALFFYLFALLGSVPLILLSFSIRFYFVWLNEVLVASGQLSAILGYKFLEYKVS